MQNKYDTNITLEDNSSLTYMLKNIEPGSTVLEFGPATGYMTRYLKEEMHCHVYIVEIDADAFETASAYAEDGICGSAEEREWCDKFQNVRFDYITFADVLEHLVNPWRVLEWATKLLKEETGKVLVSIPNIGHNAVLVDLFNDKFEYRRTGIMDNTHLRFFTHDSVIEMFRACGLHVTNEDAVVFNLEYAGFGNSETDVSENVWRELQLRKYGFVNQFLFTLSRQQDAASVTRNIKPALQYECSMYYTRGADYCEEHKVLGTVQVMNGTQFCAEFSFKEEIEFKKLLIELFPFQGTIQGMKFEPDVEIEQIMPIYGRADSDKYYFWGNEIKIEVECKTTVQQIKFLRVCGELGTVQASNLGTYLIANEREQEVQQEREALEIQRLNQVVEEKLAIIHQMGQSITEKEKLVESQNVLLREKDDTIKNHVKLLEEKDAFIEKVKKTRWFRIFEKRIMKDR